MQELPIVEDEQLSPAARGSLQPADGMRSHGGPQGTVSYRVVTVVVVVALVDVLVVVEGVG